MSRSVARLRQLLPCCALLILVCSTLAGGTSPTLAQEWQVNKSKSSISLQLSMDGQPVEARFGTFKFDIRFDPDEAEDGKITAIIDASSLSTGDSQRDALLYGPDWLNASAYPTIRLSSASIREKAVPDYRLQADLTLRGVTKRIAMPLTVDDEGTAGKVYAEADLDPAAFGMAQNGPGAGTIRFIVDITATHLTN